MKWHDDVSNLDNVAYSAIINKEKVDAECCDDPVIHIHAHRGCFSSQKKDKGGIWVWCSKCGAFSHIDGISIPKEWENNTTVDFLRVSAVPKYLDSVKSDIDKHLEKYLNND